MSWYWYANESYIMTCTLTLDFMCHMCSTRPGGDSVSSVRV